MLRRLYNKVSTLVRGNTAPPGEAFINLEDLEAPSSPRQDEPISLKQVIRGVTTLLHSKENLPKLMGVAVLTAIGTGLNFLSPYLFGETIKLLNSDEETTDIAGVQLTNTALIVILVAAYSMAQAVPNLRGQAVARMKINVERKIFKQTTEHFLNKSLNFHVNTPIGKIIYVYQKAFTVSNIGAPLYSQIIPTFIEISIGSALLSKMYGIDIGLSLLGMIATYSGYCFMTAKPIIHAREESLTVGNETWESMIGAIERYKTIHDCGKYKQVIDEIQKNLNLMAEKDRRSALLPMNVGLGHVAISRVFMTAMILIVGLGVKDNKYSTEDFAVLMAYLNQLSFLLPEFGQAVNQLFAAYPDLKFVFNELNKPAEVVDSHPDVPLIIQPDQPPAIEFKNVWFQYPPMPDATTASPMIFKDLSFKIQPGSKVAFVSASASGKSTIFNLIFGHYKPTGGEIEINGQNIWQVSLNSVRSNISLFGQNAGLFKGTVRENICFGSNSEQVVTDEMIWNIARSAHLTEFLTGLKDKLDTDVGERGNALSVGQQQKISILRNLLKKSVILMLDEITAPLDSQSATDVMQGMQEVSVGKTTLIITHKVTEAQKHADQIIVLNDGKLLAQGTHAELLATCELYKKLWESYVSQDAKPKMKNNK